MSVWGKAKAKEKALEADVEQAFQESEKVFETDAKAVAALAESAAKQFLEVAMTHLRQLTKYTGAHTGALPFKVAQQDAAKFLADFDGRKH
jgi:galactokinase